MIEKLENKFEIKQIGEKNFSLKSDINKFKNDVLILRDDYDFIILNDILSLDNRNESGSFKLVYKLLNLEEHSRLDVEVAVSESEVIETLSDVFYNASFYENEVFDLMGINFSRDYLNFFTNNRFKGHPLRKDFDPSLIKENGKIEWQNPEHEIGTSVDDKESRYWENWYPENAENKGATSFKIETEGEMVYRFRVLYGGGHKGLEKLFESKNYFQITSLVERMNLYSSLSNSIAWVKSVEELCDIDISDRSKALRMIFLEVSRVYSHLNSISEMCISLGVTSLLVPYREVKKTVEELIYAFNGHRGFLTVACIGGFRNDVNPNWITQCLEVLKEILNYQDLLEMICTRDKDWISRISRVKISSAFAINWGYSGTALRSCGVNYDLRKVSPYYFYNDIDFEIPLGIHGSCYDRYLVRMEEVRQSIKIISQILDNIPSGEMLNKDYSLNHEDHNSKEDFYNFMKDGIKPIKKEIYSYIEGNNGEFGFSIFSDGGKFPTRVKVKSPFPALLSSLEDIVKDVTVEEMNDLLLSFNLSMSEVDR